MTPQAQVNLLVVGTLALLTLGLSRRNDVTSRASDSEPQVTMFGRGSSGMRIVIYYPDTKKLYEYKDDGTCDASWTLASPARLTEDKCK